MSVSFGIVTLTAAMGAAEPTSGSNQLQQLEINCEQLAAETFHRETLNNEDRIGYRAHYNSRLNKCFYVETYRSGTPVGLNTWVYLSTLQENRIYGGFHSSTNIGVFYCTLVDKDCHSEAEFNELARPFLED